MNDCHDYVTDKRNRVKKRKLEKSSEREGDLNSLDGVNICKKKQKVPQKRKCSKKTIENQVAFEKIVFTDNVLNLPISKNSHANENTQTAHFQQDTEQEIYDLT